MIDPKFPLVPFNALNVGTECSYLIKGLIPKVGLAVLWGPPKCGKSFLTFDALLHVALGWEYRGRRVHQGAVVYVAAEGAQGIKARAEAFRQKRLPEFVDDIPFYLVPTRLDLIHDAEDLIMCIRDQIGAVEPVAVVLDTLNRTLAGSESRDEDMSFYIEAADKIREAFDCVVTIVHHCGTEGSRPRGHTSLTGAADAQIAVTKNTDGIITAKLEFMKDGPEGEEVYSSLEVVELGTDDDGDAITSCVVVEVDAPSTAQRKMNGAAKIALEQLRNAIIDSGQEPPASDHIPRTKHVVRMPIWRSYCDKGGVSNSDKPDTKRKAFERASMKLQEAEIIGVWDEWVWLSDNSDKSGQIEMSR